MELGESSGAAVGVGRLLPKPCRATLSQRLSKTAMRTAPTLLSPRDPSSPLHSVFKASRAAGADELAAGGGAGDLGSGVGAAVATSSDDVALAGALAAQGVAGGAGRPDRVKTVAGETGRGARRSVVVLEAATLPGQLVAVGREAAAAVAGAGGAEGAAPPASWAAPAGPR